MRLFIAEKPALARAIAEALGGAVRRRPGHLLCGEDDVVAWCAGHILAPAAPDAYDPAFKRWQLDHLPIVPQSWQHVVTASELLRTITALLPRAARVVHAGDPDREGQLLIDEVLVHLGYTGPVDRLLLSDLAPAAVTRALAEMRSNGHFVGLSHAALGRQRADWLYGINLTRLYTLLGRAGGYGGVLSVGRVQTPLLGLIVRRDREIEAFRPQTYFGLAAKIEASGATFSASWRSPAGAEHAPKEPPGPDGAGRLAHRDQAIRIQSAVAGRSGTVLSSTSNEKADPPPLPHNLAELQIDAGKRLGLSPHQTLGACQALYETHRLLSYPRSDCRHLPVAHHGQATAVLAAVAVNLPALALAVSGADRARRSRAFNDAQITAHHALAPTTVTADLGGLGAAERAVYELVARRYLAQFYPDCRYRETTIDLAVGDERFRASGRQILVEGWRPLLASARGTVPEPEADQPPADQNPTQRLPALREGDPVVCMAVDVLERHTTPPKRFTEAGLIEAMTGIARYVADPRIKQLLRETDGIGTPATQASIIETLFERRFVEKRGRQVASTAIGRALIDAVPAAATEPDMTALWEAAMRRIADGQMTLPAFLGAVTKQLRELVAAGRKLGTLRVPVAAASVPASQVERRARVRPASPARSPRPRP